MHKIEKQEPFGQLLKILKSSVILSFLESIIFGLVPDKYDIKPSWKGSEESKLG